MRKDIKVPVGRAGRLLKLAGAGARTGAALLSNKAADAAAARAAEALGTLRGLAAKVGQMAGYIDGFVPDAQRAAFETAMRSLQAAAPTSSSDDIRAVVESELGQPIARLYAKWDDEPIASASIGQVHQAELFDGRAVAVKVQHPGIDRAIRADLENAAVVKNLVGALAPRAMNPGAIFSEVKRRLLEELDYRLEADHQRFFRDLHSGDPRIFVPAVVDELSKVRVLTTELAAGDPLEAAAARPEPLRRTYAETLWRFVFKGNLVAGRFNADPHPGNYLFRHDGSIVFLDFGLVQPLEDQTLAQARDLHRSALERDEARFAAAVRALLKTRGGSYEELSIRFSRRCFEPLFESPFHITRRYVSEVVRSIYEIKQQMFARDKSFVQFPPELVFINRLQFGFYSVLARLDVSVDYAQVERQLLDEAHL